MLFSKLENHFKVSKYNSSLNDWKALISQKQNIPWNLKNLCSSYDSFKTASKSPIKLFSQRENFAILSSVFVSSQANWKSIIVV